MSVTTKAAWNKTGDHQITARLSDGSYNTYHTYNFETRLLIVTGGDGKLSVVPFNQLDRQAVDYLRQKLIELGGTDPHEDVKHKKLRPLSPL